MCRLFSTWNSARQIQYTNYRGWTNGSFWKSNFHLKMRPAIRYSQNQLTACCVRTKTKLQVTPISFLNYFQGVSSITRFSLYILVIDLASFLQNNRRSDPCFEVLQTRIMNSEASCHLSFMTKKKKKPRLDERLTCFVLFGFKILYASCNGYKYETLFQLFHN